MTDFAAPIHRRLTPGARSERGRASARARDDWRLMLVILAFLLFYGALAMRMSAMALSEPEEPRIGGSGAIDAARGEIADRQGRLLAGNLPAFSLYAHPQEMQDPIGVAVGLAEIFPDLDRDELLADFTSERRFMWVKRPITPRQREAVTDLGQPGLHFGSRDLRLYPAGRTAAHIVGGVTAETEAVHYATFSGSGGIERFFDERLSDPSAAARPLELSIDLAVQAAMRDVLAAEVERLDAVGAAGILIEVTTGEILGLVSLPDFDPNAPKPAVDPRAGKSPRFNRAVQGVYELGSVFKPLTAAMALDAGLVRPDSLIETGSPIYFGRQRVRDMHRMPARMTVTDIIRRSSNVGSARLALAVTTPRFQEYLDRLGMFDAAPVELSEATGSTPLRPPKWTELSTMNISFGHGLAVSPMHLAAAYATLANGGRRVVPTLVKGGGREGGQVFGERAAAEVLAMLREVVTDGTGRRADAPGYEVAGKTGTADKPRENGPGYDRTKVLATFASVWPASRPQYALVVSLDEPTDRSGKYPSRQASRTAAPATRMIVERVAPLLGLRPVGTVEGAAGPVPTGN